MEGKDKGRSGRREKGENWKERTRKDLDGGRKVRTGRKGKG